MECPHNSQKQTWVCVCVCVWQNTRPKESKAPWSTPFIFPFFPVFCFMDYTTKFIPRHHFFSFTFNFCSLAVTCPYLTHGEADGGRSHGGGRAADSRGLTDGGGAGGGRSLVSASRLWVLDSASALQPSGSTMAPSSLLSAVAHQSTSSAGLPRPSGSNSFAGAICSAIALQILLVALAHWLSVSISGFSTTCSAAVGQHPGVGSPSSSMAPPSVGSTVGRLLGCGLGPAWLLPPSDPPWPLLSSPWLLPPSGPPWLLLSSPWLLPSSGPPWPLLSSPWLLPPSDPPWPLLSSSWLLPPSGPPWLLLSLFLAPPSIWSALAPPVLFLAPPSIWSALAPPVSILAPPSIISTLNSCLFVLLPDVPSSAQPPPVLVCLPSCQPFAILCPHPHNLSFVLLLSPPPSLPLLFLARKAAPSGRGATVNTPGPFVVVSPSCAHIWLCSCSHCVIISWSSHLSSLIAALLSQVCSFCLRPVLLALPRVCVCIFLCCPEYPCCGIIKDYCIIHLRHRPASFHTPSLDRHFEECW